MLLKRCHQLCGDRTSIAGFNLGTRHEVHELAVAQQSDGRRRWRIWREVVSSLLSGVAVLTGKDCDGLIRLRSSLLQGQSNSGTHLACCTSTYRVDNHHRGP